MRDASQNLAAGLLRRVLERSNYADQKPVQGRIRRVAPDFERKLVQICEGSEEVRFFLRLERRADLIAKIASQEAKFRAVGLADGLADTGEFAVAELANIGRHGAVSLGKNQQPITAATIAKNAAAFVFSVACIAGPAAYMLLGGPHA